MKRERFPGRVPKLPCEDVKAAAEEGKSHTDRLLEVSI